MKKNVGMYLIVTGLILLVIGTILAYVLKNDDSTTNLEIDNILDTEWSRENSSDTEVIYFSKDGDFSYYEVGAGNPVGDYDLCETYSFKGDTFRLNCSDEDIIDEINLVSYDENKLVLDFDGEERTFNKEVQ